MHHQDIPDRGTCVANCQRFAAKSLVLDLGFYVFHTSTYTSTVVLCYSPLIMLAHILYQTTIL